MRYKGQAYEIDIALSAAALSMSAVIAEFHESHAQRCGYRNPKRSTEVAQFRLRASA